MSPPPLPWLRRLNQARPITIVLLSLALIALIGLADYALGSEISLTLFYLLPIGLLAWYLGGRWGAAGALLAAAVWLGANLASGLKFSAPAIYVWNSLMRVAINLVVAYLFSELRRALRLEQHLARTDDMTGALNSRAFQEIMQVEIARANRYNRPLTLAYVDLDNFKQVNDRFGHEAGNAVLKETAKQCGIHIRLTDLAGRYGGDEFVVVLVGTGEEGARVVVEKVRAAVEQAGKGMGYPDGLVTASIGVAEYRPDKKDEDVLVAADRALYRAKAAGRNQVATGESQT